MKRTLAPLLILCVFLASCAATPTDKWFQARSTLTTVTTIIDEGNAAGLIDDVTYVEVLHPKILISRAYLDKAFERLPEGGTEFDQIMDALDAVLITLKQ